MDGQKLLLRAIRALRVLRILKEAHPPVEPNCACCADSPKIVIKDEKPISYYSKEDVTSSWRVVKLVFAWLCCCFSSGASKVSPNDEEKGLKTEEEKTETLVASDIQDVDKDAIQTLQAAYEKVKGVKPTELLECLQGKTIRLHELVDEANANPLLKRKQVVMRLAEFFKFIHDSVRSPHQANEEDRLWHPEVPHTKGPAKEQDQKRRHFFTFLNRHLEATYDDRVVAKYNEVYGEVPPRPCDVCGCTTKKATTEDMKDKKCHVCHKAATYLCATCNFYLCTKHAEEGPDAGFYMLAEVVCNRAFKENPKRTDTGSDTQEISFKDLYDLMMKKDPLQGDIKVLQQPEPPKPAPKLDPKPKRKTVPQCGPALWGIRCGCTTSCCCKDDDADAPLEESKEPYAAAAYSPELKELVSDSTDYSGQDLLKKFLMRDVYVSVEGVIAKMKELVKPEPGLPELVLKAQVLTIFNMSKDVTATEGKDSKVPSKFELMSLWNLEQNYKKYLKHVNYSQSNKELTAPPALTGYSLKTAAELCVPGFEALLTDDEKKQLTEHLLQLLEDADRIKTFEKAAEWEDKAQKQDGELYEMCEDVLTKVISEAQKRELLMKVAPGSAQKLNCWAKLFSCCSVGWRGARYEARSGGGSGREFHYAPCEGEERPSGGPSMGR